MYSLFSKILVISSVYVLGRLNYSVGWVLPLLLSAVYDHCRQSHKIQRAEIQARSLMNESDWILPKFDDADLPPWVIFPDVERAEWINTILKMLWPKINELVTRLLQDLQPKIAQHSAFQKFQFETINLGNIVNPHLLPLSLQIVTTDFLLQTPRITGVKVHKHNSNQNYIMVDCNILYVGDSELSFSLNHIQAGIKNIELDGTFRILLKNDSTAMPLSGLEISFLESPTFDFELMTALAPLDMFLTGDLLRAIIKEQISRQMVFPNKIYIKFKNIERENLIPKIDGILRVGIGTVDGIVGFDNQTLKTVIELGKEMTIATERHIVNGTGIVNYEADFVKYSSNDGRLDITVIVKSGFEEVSSFKGSVDVTNLCKNEKLIGKYPLSPVGSISMTLSWFILNSDIKCLQKEPGKNSALLQVMIKSVKNLPPNLTRVFVQLTIDGQSKKTKTLDPKSSTCKHFSFLLVDPEFETLEVKLTDQLSSDEIGYYSYNIGDLMNLEKMEHNLEFLPLTQTVLGSNVEIEMMLKLSVLVNHLND